MRYLSAYLGTTGSVPVFLLNVPSTWESPQARRLYREELARLGRFLITCGGCEPSFEDLVSRVKQYDARRSEALLARPKMSARRWAETLVHMRSDMDSGTVVGGNDEPREGIPLALIGGPLPAEDDVFLDLVARAGGRIVVDASEGGERTLPAPVDERRLKEDPLDELVRMYFDTIPDVFRRPNARLYEWLDEHLAAEPVRGIILRRYPFCDLWHAELHRLREWSDVPVLDLDVVVGDEGESNRTLGRIEAFLEMLR
jgi:hypothetical protein